jgi:hypothetical protein
VPEEDVKEILKLPAFPGLESKVASAKEGSASNAWELRDGKGDFEIDPAHSTLQNISTSATAPWLALQKK